MNMAGQIDAADSSAHEELAKHNLIALLGREQYITLFLDKPILCLFPGFFVMYSHFRKNGNCVYVRT